MKDRVRHTFALERMLLRLQGHLAEGWRKANLECRQNLTATHRYAIEGDMDAGGGQIAAHECDEAQIY